MICGLDFPYFIGVHLHVYDLLHGYFSFGKTSGPTINGRRDGSYGSDQMVLIKFIFWSECFRKNR